MKTPISVKIPDTPMADLERNRDVVFAAFRSKGEIRMRINIDVYAPGTKSNPKARYYAMCKVAPTLVFRSLHAVVYFLNVFRKMVESLEEWKEEEHVA